MTDAAVSPEWEQLGLFDPRAPNADERREVLAFFEANGVNPADYHDVPPAELPSAVNRRAVRSGPRVGRAAAAEAAGVSVAMFDRLIEVTGYPADGANFTPVDIETIALFNVAAAFFSEEEMVHFSAVMASSLARIADAAASLFRIDISHEIEAAGGSELEYAKKNFEAAELVKAMRGPLWALFALQLELASSRGDASRSGVSPDADASLLRMGIGFVDLVGFTPMAVEASASELAGFIRDFEQQATGIITSRGGRLVKLIGDEVMFAAVGADESVQIAVELMSAFSERGVQPHAGVSHGDVIGRGGDYYGTVVNLASRIAALAVPGELLVDDTTAAAAGTHTFEPAGRRLIKGFPEPVRLSSHVR